MSCTHVQCMYVRMYCTIHTYVYTVYVCICTVVLYTCTVYVCICTVLYTCTVFVYAVAVRLCSNLAHALCKLHVCLHCVHSTVLGMAGTPKCTVDIQHQWTVWSIRRPCDLATQEFLESILTYICMYIRMYVQISHYTQKTHEGWIRQTMITKPKCTSKRCRYHVGRYSLLNNTHTYCTYIHVH